MDKIRPNGPALSKGNKSTNLGKEKRRCREVTACIMLSRLTGEKKENENPPFPSHVEALEGQRASFILMELRAQGVAGTFF